MSRFTADSRRLCDVMWRHVMTVGVCCRSEISEINLGVDDTGFTLMKYYTDSPESATFIRVRTFFVAVKGERAEVRRGGVCSVYTSVKSGSGILAVFLNIIGITQIRYTKSAPLRGG